MAHDGRQALKKEKLNTCKNEQAATKEKRRKPKKSLTCNKDNN
jgi:hypothetical protein